MQRSSFCFTRAALLIGACLAGLCSFAAAQDAAAPPAAAPPDAPTSVAAPAAPAQPASATPNAATLHSHTTPLTPKEVEDARIAALPSLNGRPYDQPSHKDQFFDYLRDSYGWPAAARSLVRSLYEEGLDKPSGWSQEFPGFMQRVGSNAAITAIDGTVRLGMETVFQEDMKYIPCHGCSIKRKITNALLSEVTARHDVNGRRFFTLTPAISDFSGPIIANYVWYPNHDPFGGVVATRTVAATRVGQHLFTEFVLERRHHDPKLGD